ncbi:hypothetical protein HYH03_007483 [Edaphochlamys debaryana]|uniref:Ankyrin repeat domain-containing protein n=1 Tax=Edaphochlamys debaryana TaxID=47281 RepID=A0A835Y1X8_9CHLO|nr:hypothetical protein HYH03_007483 [Edaphochlamys debaryana]|eukprot:KAG2494431.1 hypothetical protein HYH03_007483 [Edaphochlamys debaryana]
MTLAERHQLVSLTASSGDVVNLDVAVQASGCAGPTHAAREAAAATGALLSCQYLCEPGRLDRVYWRDVLPAAARAGHLHIVDWALASGAGRDCCASAAAAAAECGHTQLMRHLLSQAPSPLPSEDLHEVTCSVAEGCDLATLQHFCAQPELQSELWSRPGGKDYYTKYAAASATPDWRDKVEWLRAQGGHLTPFCWSLAARLPEEATAMSDALEAGNAAAVRWLAAQGVRLGVKGALWKAARAGLVEVLQALHEGNCEVSVQDAAYWAASGGSLPLLRWLQATYGLEAMGLGGGPASLLAELCGVAAGSGSAEALRWLLDQGREPGHGPGAEDAAFGRQVWSKAAEAGSGPVLRLLHAEGFAKPTDGDPYAKAAANDDLQTLATLRELGLPWGPGDGAVLRAAVWAQAGLPTLQWMVAHGCPVDWASAEAAARARFSGPALEALVAWMRGRA